MAALLVRSRPAIALSTIARRMSNIGKFNVLSIMSASNCPLLFIAEVYLKGDQFRTMMKGRRLLACAIRIVRLCQCLQVRVQDTLLLGLGM